MAIALVVELPASLYNFAAAGGGLSLILDAPCPAQRGEAVTVTCGARPPLHLYLDGVYNALGRSVVAVGCLWHRPGVYALRGGLGRPGGK